MKRLAAALLCGALLLTPALGAEGEQDQRFASVQQFPGYADLPPIGSGYSWCYDSAKVCYETKLMIGNGDGTFTPQEELTVAQCAAVAAVLYSRAHGGDGVMERIDGQPWWYGPVTYMTNVATEHNDWTSVALLTGTAPDEAPISRLGFLLLLNLAATEDMLTPVGSAQSMPDTDEPIVMAFYNAGILSGYPDGTFRGGNTITRAECAVMAALLIRPELRVEPA